MNACLVKMLATENKGQRQHHCPQCFKIAGPRCARKGHVIRCNEHLTYHSPYSECPQCKDARLRDERQASHASDGDGGGNDPNINPNGITNANTDSGNVSNGNGNGKRNKDAAAAKSGGKKRIQKKQKAKKSKVKGKGNGEE